MMKAFLVAVAALALASCAGTIPAPGVELRLIAFNDFHGHIEPPPFGQDVPDPASPKRARRIAAGGAAHLASAIRELRGGRPHVAVVAAGDLVSASPLVSSLFLDEPAVEALDAAGLELSSLGNHEFDRGRDELLRLQRGGCAGPETCRLGPFRGARFRWLAANVFDTSTGERLFPAYEIREYGGISVAFVGAVLKGTPQIVLASGVKGLEFRDEAESVNALLPEIRARGAEAIVLLIHEGGRLNGALGDPSCPNFRGAIVDIVKRLDPAIDFVVSGHTHDIYVCRLGGRLVTSAGAYGRAVTVIDLVLDRSSRDVSAASARTVFVDHARFEADPAIAERVSRVAAKAAESTGRLVGRIRGEFSASANAAGESNLGNLVADAHLFALRDTGAEIAFTNPGGLRAPLASRRPDGGVTFGDLYSVQPFGNTLVTMTLTGGQLLRVLEEQWRAPPDRSRILPVAGLRYAWDGRRPIGARVVRDSVRVGDAPLDPARRYRVAVNSFLAYGGDGFNTFKEGADVREAMLDVAALEIYLAADVREARPPGGRIVRAGDSR